MEPTNAPRSMFAEPSTAIGLPAVIMGAQQAFDGWSVGNWAQVGAGAGLAVGGLFAIFMRERGAK